jgi:hypothetical protein
MRHCLTRSQRRRVPLLGPHATWRVNTRDALLYESRLDELTRVIKRSDQSMLNWLKHAFSVSRPGTVQPTQAQANLIDRVCREIIRRKMTLPAQMLLESSAPLHYLAGQTIRFVEPMLGTVLDAGELRDFATFLEQPGAVEHICRRLQELQEIECSTTAPTPSDDKASSLPRAKGNES